MTNESDQMLIHRAAQSIADGQRLADVRNQIRGELRRQGRSPDLVDQILRAARGTERSASRRMGLFMLFVGVVFLILGFLIQNGSLAFAAMTGGSRFVIPGGMYIVGALTAGRGLLRVVFG